MSLMRVTPCDYSGVCPYNATYNSSCAYWCSASESENYSEEDYDDTAYSWDEDDDYFVEEN